MTKEVWITPESLAILKRQFDAVDPLTWHKMMNPFCGQCLAERGQQFLTDSKDEDFQA